MGSVGTARFFASHTWKAPFHDLVAALAHVLADDDYVWIDVCNARLTQSAAFLTLTGACLRPAQIFAVLQWDREDGLSEALAKEKAKAKAKAQREGTPPPGKKD